MVDYLPLLIGKYDVDTVFRFCSSIIDEMMCCRVGNGINVAIHLIGVMVQDEC
jgi:hypothetical protein